MNDFADIDYIDPDNYVFTFGVYKGVDYADVKHDNPGYILWCYDNLKWFNISSDEIDELIELTSEEDRDIGDVNPGYLFEWDDLPF